MPKSSPKSSKASFRLHRVADLVQEQVALILNRELRDPRLPDVTVCAVKMSRDLSFTKIYVIFTAPEAKRAEILGHLNKASSHVRRLLADRIALRVVPTLRFVYDESIERGQYLSDLIEQACQSDVNKK